MNKISNALNYCGEKVISFPLEYLLEFNTETLWLHFAILIIVIPIARLLFILSDWFRMKISLKEIFVAILTVLTVISLLIPIILLILVGIIAYLLLFSLTIKLTHSIIISIIIMMIISYIIFYANKLIKK